MSFSNALDYQVANGQLIQGSTNNQISSVAYSATGGTSNAVSRDSSGNTSANSFISKYTSTATAAGTTILTVASTQTQVFTGSTTQTVVMPVTSTLVLGQKFTIINSSSGVVTVQSSGANTIQAMASGTWLTLTVVNTAVTDATGWQKFYFNPSATILSFANVGSSANAQGASVSGTTITLQPASSTQPGLITAGTQTISGAKTIQGGTFTYSGSTLQNFAITANQSSFTGTGTTPTFTTTYQFNTLSNSSNPVTINLANSNSSSAVNFQGFATFNKFYAITSFLLKDTSNSTVTGSNADIPNTVFNVPQLEFTNSSLASIATWSTDNGSVGWFINRTSNSIQIVDQYSGSIPALSNAIRTGYNRNITLLNTQMAQLSFDFNASPQVGYITGGTFQRPLEDGVSGSLASSPVSSSTATSAFVTSLTAGTAQQNTAGYDLLVNITVVVSTATGATLTLGVGPTSTPTTQTVVPSFTLAVSAIYTFRAYVPNNYYLLVNSTGTITISSITTMAMGI